jgi:hypothetical protein
MRRFFFSWLILPFLAVPGGSADSHVGGNTYDGEELTCDLPGDQHIKNIGSRRDGAGMCVMSSVEMAARWDGLEEYRGLRDWCANEAGGAYPEKVDDQLKRYAKAKGLPEPRYFQYTGEDPGPLLELIDTTGRMAAVAYGTSPRYGGQAINHMVCCPKYSGKYGVVLDNNFPGADRYEWIPRAELIRRMKTAAGPGGRATHSPAWVFVWLDAPPPPVPHNP